MQTFQLDFFLGVSYGKHNGQETSTLKNAFRVTVSKMISSVDKPKASSIPSTQNKMLHISSHSSATHTVTTENIQELKNYLGCIVGSKKKTQDGCQSKSED